MGNKRLEKAYEAYWYAVNEEALFQYRWHILPWLEQWNYQFVAGNGTYYIEYKRGSKWVQIDHDDLPKNIGDILNMEIPGYDGGYLGSLMPDRMIKE